MIPKGAFGCHGKTGFSALKPVFRQNWFFRGVASFGCHCGAAPKPVFTQKNRFYKNLLRPGFSTQKPVSCLY
jgi:hypothetical protein